MNARVKTKLLCLTVLAAGALTLARFAESTVHASPSSTNQALSRAFGAIVGIEAVVNARDGNGAYLVANVEHFLAVVRRHQAVGP